jgi:HK97 family phage portal protein
MRLGQALVNAAWQVTRPREKAIAPLSTAVPGTGGWWPIVREPYTGAWQRNQEWRVDTVLTYSAVFRSVSLISSDIAKMRIRLVEQGADGIWREVDRNSPFWPVLRKPNRYQNRIQFFTSWMESKLIHGNSYVLKERDERNVVTMLHVLNPELVKVLVTPDGSVWYELRPDNLGRGQSETVTIPAREIIHDRWNTLYHPLVGTSPITACGLAATQGMQIARNSIDFFANNSKASGVILVPAGISREQAWELARTWDERKAGSTAVLTGGAQYTPLTMSATDAQLLEQGKWTAETVASCFGVPAFKIGVGPPPSYNNIEALDAQYYAQCLQAHIESIELCLDEGLELKGPLGTEFDLDDLLRMDTATQMKVQVDGVKAGILKPDEARAKFSLAPTPGGDTPYMQEQQWPLRHLAERDLPSRPVTPPSEIEPNGDDGGDTEPDTDAADAERERTVISFQGAIERAAREHERRSA